MFYQVLLRLFPVCFPDFIRQIARYPPHKIRKTSSFKQALTLRPFLCYFMPFSPE